MLKVGITVGMGTGKTFVSQLFRLLNIPIYDSDSRAKWLCEHDDMLVASIKNLLGTDAYTKAGNYNKPFVAKQIFNNPDLKIKLEQIIHPAVQADCEKWFSDLASTRLYPYALKEAALLFESGSSKYLDKIVVVDAPLSVRIQRIQNRDHTSTAEIVSRINNQWANEDKVKLADFIINNDEIHPVIPQVLVIHKKLVALNQEKHKV